MVVLDKTQPRDALGESIEGTLGTVAPKADLANVGTDIANLRAEMLAMEARLHRTILWMLTIILTAIGVASALVATLG